MKKRKFGWGRMTLTALVLAAAELLPGCSSKEDSVPQVPQADPKIPVAEQKVLGSDDGSFAAFSVAEGTDLESYLFSLTNNSNGNLSNDALFSDRPAFFVGSHLVMRAQRNFRSEEKIKLYDVSTGVPVFASQEFEWVGTLIPYVNGSKVLYQGFENGWGALFTNAVGSSVAEKMFPNSTGSYVMTMSDDGSIVFINEFTTGASASTVMHVLNTVDGTVRQIMSPAWSHWISQISKNDEKAAALYWDGIDNLLKIIDVPSASVQAVANPAGKQAWDAAAISDNGCGLVAILQDNATSQQEFQHLNLQNYSWKPIMPRDVGGLMFNCAGMSQDGELSAFVLDTYQVVRLFNSVTDDLYDPLSIVPAYNNADFVGFTVGNKALISFFDTIYGIRQAVLHDPVTKTNKELVNPSDYLGGRVQLTPNNEHVVISAYKPSINRDVILLEDIALGTRKEIGNENTSFICCGMSPDSRHILLIGYREKENNLFDYDMVSGQLRQVTAYGHDGLSYVDVHSHSKDNKKLFFSARFINNTKEIFEFDYETRQLTFICN